MAEQVGAVFVTVEARADGLAASIETEVEASAKAIEKTLNRRLGPVVDKATERLAESFADAFEDVADELDDTLVDGFEDATKEMVRTAERQGGRVTDAFGDEMRKVERLLDDVAEGAFEDLDDEARDSTRDVARIFGRLADDIEDEFDDVADGAFDDMPGEARDAARRVERAFDDVADAIARDFDEVGEEAFDELVEEAREARRDLERVFDRVSDDAVVEFDRIARRYDDTMEELVDDTRTGVRRINTELEGLAPPEFGTALGAGAGGFLGGGGGAAAGGGAFDAIAAGGVAGALAKGVAGLTVGLAALGAVAVKQTFDVIVGGLRTIAELSLEAGRAFGEFAISATIDQVAVQASVAQLAQIFPDEFASLGAEGFTDYVQEIAKAVGITTQAAADVAFISGSVGTPFGDLPAVTALVEDFALATSQTIEEAGSQIAAVSGGLGVESVEELAVALDQVTKAGAGSTTVASEILAAVLPLIPAASLLGSEFADAAAAIAILDTRGIAPSRGATAVKALQTELLRVDSPLALFIEATRGAFAPDILANGESFVDLLRQVAIDADKADIPLASLIPNTEALQGFAGLAGDDNFEGYAEAIRRVVEESEGLVGSSAEIARALGQDFLTEAIANVGFLREDIGQLGLILAGRFGGGFLDFVDTVRDRIAEVDIERVGDAIEEFGAAVRRGLEGVGDLLEGVLDAIGLGDDRLSGVEQATALFEGLLDIAGSLAEALGTVASAFGDLFGTVGSAEVKVGGVDAVYGDALDATLPVVDQLEGFNGSTAEFTENIEGITDAIDGLADGVSTLVGFLDEFVAVLKAVTFTFNGPGIGLTWLVDITKAYDEWADGVEHVGSVFSGLKSVLEGIDLTSVGFRIIQSFIQGLTSGQFGGFAVDVGRLIGDAIISTVASVLEDIEDAINRAIDVINRLPFTSLPHVDIPTPSPSSNKGNRGGGGGGFRALAEGGIVTGPTLALFGEAGDEAVIPLDGPQVRPFAAAVAEAMDGRGRGGSYRDGPRSVVTVNQTISTPVRDPALVAASVVDRLAVRAGL